MTYFFLSRFTDTTQITLFIMNTVSFYYLILYHWISIWFYYGKIRLLKYILTNIKQSIKSATRNKFSSQIIFKMILVVFEKIGATSFNIKSCGFRSLFCRIFRMSVYTYKKQCLFLNQFLFKILIKILIIFVCGIPKNNFFVVEQHKCTLQTEQTHWVCDLQSWFLHCCLPPLFLAEEPIPNFGSQIGKWLTSL